jgi:hypothetical protein
MAWFMQTRYDTLSRVSHATTQEDSSRPDLSKHRMHHEVRIRMSHCLEEEVGVTRKQKHEQAKHGKVVHCRRYEPPRPFFRAQSCRSKTGAWGGGGKRMEGYGDNRFRGTGVCSSAGSSRWVECV